MLPVLLRLATQYGRSNGFGFVRITAFKSASKRNKLVHRWVRKRNTVLLSSAFFTQCWQPNFKTLSLSYTSVNLSFKRHLSFLKRAYFTSAIDRVFSVGRACDKQTRDTFQSSRSTVVKPWAVITLRTLWREVGRRSIQVVKYSAIWQATQLQ